MLAFAHCGKYCPDSFETLWDDSKKLNKHHLTTLSHYTLFICHYLRILIDFLKKQIFLGLMFTENKKLEEVGSCMVM